MVSTVVFHVSPLSLLIFVQRNTRWRNPSPLLALSEAPPESQFVRLPEAEARIRTRIVVHTTVTVCLDWESKLLLLTYIGIPPTGREE